MPCIHITMPATYYTVMTAIKEFMVKLEYSCSCDNIEIIYDTLVDYIDLFTEEIIRRQNTKDKDPLSLVRFLSVCHKKAKTLSEQAKQFGRTNLLGKYAKIIGSKLDYVGYSTDATPLRRSSRI